MTLTSSEVATTADMAALVKNALKQGKLNTLVGLVSKEIEETKPKKVISVETRKAAMRKLMEEQDEVFIKGVKEVMAGYAKHTLPTQDLPVLMGQEHVDQLAAEWLDYRAILDFLEARRDLMRERVFASITAKFELAEKKGQTLERPADMMDDKLISEEMGVSFSREGGKRKDPTINWDKLREQLTQEQYEALCDKVKVARQVIPAHVDLIPNEQRLMDAIGNGEVSLVQVKEAVIPGAFTPVKFVPRKIS